MTILDNLFIHKTKEVKGRLSADPRLRFALAVSLTPAWWPRAMEMLLSGMARQLLRQGMFDVARGLPAGRLPSSGPEAEL